MPPKTDELILIENLSAGYDGHAAIEHVSLSVRRGDYVGVIGPNGGGKTTLIKAILGLIKPMSGTIRRGDFAMGYLPQVSSIDRQFPASTREVVLSGLQGSKRWWQRYTKDERRAADELLEQMGVAHLAHKSTGELSGGEMQRVLLCRALICRPELLILDEPTTYVDNKFEGEFYEILHHLNHHLAIIMVSHDLGTICSYVKSIACVNHTLHYHPSNVITEEQLELYDCPIQLLEHGAVPHTVLHKH